ncbi:MAG: alkaline phosphatase D family protein [Woeseiaceae bacterium]
MRRKHLVIGSIVVLIASAIWSIGLIAPMHYRLPDAGFDPADYSGPVYMVNGLKIGEVSSDSAILWTRLTRNPEMDPETDWGRLVSGVPGEVRASYWPVDDENLRVETPWSEVDADKDFTRQLHLANLTPATDYFVLVEGRPLDDVENVSQLEGKFRTAPGGEQVAQVRFSVLTGQAYHRRDDDENGHKIFKVMESMDLDFLVHTGDIIYYDKPEPYATTLPVARFKWNRMFALPYQRSFFNQTSSYFMKDDHDTLKNDSWPGQWFGDLTWAQGLALFREQVPMGEHTYRTFRWGKNLQIWLVEGRDFRSENMMADGPDKSIWGDAQKNWLFESVKASDATYRILISPTPIVGPDRGDKYDNHANPAFATEGAEIRSFVASQENMFIICGDRHWQYVSEDPETGVIEFSAGPTTDRHANGFSEKDESSMHRYLKVKGGFLAVSVSPDAEEPEITFTHHAVDGSIYNQETFSRF